MRRIALVAAAVIALAAPRTANAQVKLTPEQIEQAKAHYKKGVAAMSQGDFSIAAREFGIAYEITKDPVLFYRIGEAYQKSQDCDSALIYYRRYLRDAKPAKEEDRQLTEQRITECEETLGGTGDTGDTGMMPLGDDDDDGGAGDGGAGAGDGGAGAGVGGEGGDGGDGGAFVDERASWHRTGAWVSVGLAVAFGTTGAVLGLAASSREEDIDQLLAFRDVNGNPSRYQGEVTRKYEEFVDEGERLNKLALISFGVAGAATATAVVFFILDATGGDEKKGDGDTASGGLGLRPVVTNNGFGVSAGWEF